MSSNSGPITRVASNESFGPVGASLSKADADKVARLVASRDRAAALKDADTFVQSHPLVAQSLRHGYDYLRGLVKANRDSSSATHVVSVAGLRG